MFEDPGKDNYALLQQAQIARGNAMRKIKTSNLKTIAK